MPRAQHREHEAKFQVAPEVLASLQLPPLSLDGYTNHSIGTIDQIDTYLDTPAYDLLRQGLALRVRKKGATYEVGLKSIQATRKGAIQNRMDIATALPACAKPFDASTWPDEIEEQLAPYAIDLDDLHPLVLVHQQRQKAHIFLNGTDQPLAEWSLDEVWFETELEETKASQPDTAAVRPANTHFYELEIELLAPLNDSHSGDSHRGDAHNGDLHSDGEDKHATGQETEAKFATLVAHVQERFNLSPIYTSKLVRGLESALAHRHDNATALTPTMALEAAGRLLLHQQLFQILLNEHGVRTSKKAKYVHDMRVAIRRARAAIHLCATAYPPDALTSYAKGLKQLAQALGAVRDLDVARENLSEFARNQPEGQQHGIKLLRRELKIERTKNHTKLVKVLNSKRHRKFIKSFTAFCVTPVVETNDPAEVAFPHPSQVRHTMPSKILAAFEAMRAFEIVFADNQDPPLEIFHACRIQGKYLRYLLEFTQHLLGTPGKELGDQLSLLQERLGQLNDAHTEQIRLHKWAEMKTVMKTGMKTEKDTKTAQGENGLNQAIEMRQAEITARINELGTTIPARFHEFISLPNREKLATALATL